MRPRSPLLKASLLFCLQMFFIISMVMAQKNPVAVSGTVVDEKNIPLQGVSVQVKGGKVIAITNKDGSFSGTADKDAVLQFTYKGYGLFERAVKDGVFDVALSLESQSLDNVVVIGYGVQKKRAV